MRKLLFIFSFLAFSFSLASAQTVSPPPRGGTGLSLGVTDTMQILSTNGRNPMHLLPWLNDSAKFLGSDLLWHTVSGGGGKADSIYIGIPVGGSNTQNVLFIDNSFHLAKDDNFVFDPGTFTFQSPNINISNSIITTANMMIGTVQYNWTLSQGAANTVLTNDGSGNLSWAAGGGSGVDTTYPYTWLAKHTWQDSSNAPHVRMQLANLFDYGSPYQSAPSPLLQFNHTWDDGSSQTHIISWLLGARTAGGIPSPTEVFQLIPDLSMGNPAVFQFVTDTAGKALLQMLGSSGSSDLQYITLNSPRKVTALLNGVGLNIDDLVSGGGLRLHAGNIASGINWTLTFPDSAGNPGEVLKTDGFGNTYWQSAGGGGLVNWIDSINNAAPNDVIPAIAFVVKTDSVDADAVVQPKGNGALLAHIPDGTTVGGVKRGIKAVDLQQSRGSNTAVAAGNYSALVGGSENKVTGEYGAILGGVQNTVDADSSSVVGGGGNHIPASGTYSVICGGLNNSIQGKYSSVLGGNGNAAAGNFSSVIGGVSFGISSSATSSFGFGGKPLTHIAGSNEVLVDSSNVGLFSNVDIWIGNTDSTVRALKFYGSYISDGIQRFPNVTKYVGIKSPDAPDSSVTYTLPRGDGASGQFLKTDGAHNLSWASVSSGSGTVTSVALTAPSIFTVSGSPVTTSGTLDFALNTQTTNKVFAAPNGSTGVPTFRTLAIADLPSGYNYYTWSTSSSTSFSASAAHAYNTTAGSQATVTLPGSPSDNDRVLIKGNNTGGWIINGTPIHFPGITYLISVASGDGSLELVWNATTGVWDVLSDHGTIIAN